MQIQVLPVQAILQVQTAIQEITQQVPEAAAHHLLIVTAGAILRTVTAVQTIIAAAIIIVRVHRAHIQQAVTQEAVQVVVQVVVLEVVPVVHVVQAEAVEVDDNISISNFQYQISKIDKKT